MDQEESQVPDRSGDAYSSGITRHLCREAGHLIDMDTSTEDVTEQLRALMDGIDKFSDSECAQLQEVINLLASEGNVEIPEELNVDGEFSTTLSQDRMFLLLTIRPPLANGKAVEVRQIIDHLRNQNIQRGVILPVIRDAVSKAAVGNTVSDVVIVKGTPPERGRDGSVRFYGRRHIDEKLSVVSEASLSSKEKTPWLCQEGDVIGKLFPAALGKPGCDAAGQPIAPPPVHEAEVNLGQNVARDEDQITAMVGGVVCYNTGTLYVTKTLVRSEDVTSHDGPIKFDGDVHIHGAVRSKAEVIATGQIIVYGAVEAAKIESTGGDVILMRGVAGQGRGVIRAAGDITARFAEQASLFAGGDIHLQLGTLHSHAQAGGHISAVQGKGQLLGGTLIAGKSIETKRLGGAGESPTIVIVGLSAKAMENIGELNLQRTPLMIKWEEARDLADKMLRAVANPKRFSSTEKAVYARLRQVELVAQQTVQKIDEKIDTIAAADSKNNTGTVRVFNQMESRVEITIGSATYKNTQSRGPTTVRVDPNTGRIKVESSI